MASNEIDIEKIFLILRLRAKLVIGILAAAVFVAAVITYQMPKMYQATSTLNFDFSGTNPVDDRGRSILSQDSYLTTQVGILQSLNVAQKVVNGFSDYERERVIAALEASHSTIDRITFGVKQFIKSLFSSSDTEGEEYDVQDAGEPGFGADVLPVGPRYDWLARAIGYDLDVVPEVNSRLVKVSYLSTDPQIAALVADRFAEAYIATSLAMVIDPARKTKVWFDEQLKSLRERLEDAQATLTAYQQKEGIVSSDQRIDLASKKLQSLAEQLSAAQQATRNAESEQQKLQEVLNTGASLTTFEPIADNVEVQKIKAEIRDFEGKLVENMNTLGENHPKIKRLKSELAAARGRLNNEIKTITDGITNAASLSRDREKTLETAVDEQKQLVLMLKGEHDKIAVLQRDVDSAQTAYNAALNQLNTTSMQSMLDQTNVSVVDHASVPSVHATPRITKNLALGVLGGLILGVGLALFMEVFVRRVHSEDDLADELGIPLLGHLGKT